MTLREVAHEDLPVFFDQQRDAESLWMAAFTAEDPTDRAAFDVRWEAIRDDDSIVARTVLWDGLVAGHLTSFVHRGDREVGYWFGRAFWGRGVASAALAEFLHIVSTRPLYARAAQDHRASIRVLEKCGFVICGEDGGFAHGRGREVEEFVLRLSEPPGKG